MLTPLRPYRQPDLHAPRYRRPLGGTLNQHTYATLREQVPQVAHLTDKQLKELVVAINQRIWQTLLQNPDGVELPQRTGHLFLASCPQRKRPSIDYKASAETGCQIEHRNFDTDGHQAKIFYTNHATRYNFKHHELWGFEGCRNFKQTVGETYPRQWQMYHLIVPDRKLKHDSYQQQRLLRQTQVTSTELTTYNELDF